MQIAPNGMLMRIFVAEGRQRRHADVFREIVEALASAGIAGATAFRGIAGYSVHADGPGGSSVLLASVPVLVEVVDDERKVRDFLPTLEAILEDGLVTLERVQQLVRRADANPASGGP